MENKRWVLAPAILALVAVGLLVGIAPRRAYANYTPHAPISINGNSGFTKPDPVNGGGSGTAGDPYIIENYAISAASADGIYVKNTTAYFIMRRCLVENGADSYVGIYLDNVTNGRVENNICNKDFDYDENDQLARGAINMENSNYCVITLNLCGNCNSYAASGIMVKNGQHDNITNNVCDNLGPMPITSSDEGRGTGLYTSFYCIVDNNLWENISHNGINLAFGSCNNTVSNNTVRRVGYSGIDLYMGSNNNSVYGNLSDNTEDGIELENNDDNNHIYNNVCVNCMDKSSGAMEAHGIAVMGVSLDYTAGRISTNNIIENNTCNNDNVGIRLAYADNNLIKNNTCNNNALYGIRAYSSKNNTIYFNHLSNNVANNAYDDSSNAWDNQATHRGNYWSNYQTDTNQDGRYDNGAVTVSGGGNKDNYPLIAARDPLISIGDNTQFTDLNGVSGGNGTANNPYVIENYRISALSTNGIDIEGTTAYFVVRNCLVENGGSSYQGIYLNTVIHGTVRNNTCNNNDYGIDFGSNSNYCVIDNNSCSNNFDGGAHLWHDNYDNLTNNVCFNTHGRDNENIYKNGIAVYYTYYCTISNNFCDNGSHTGIKLSQSYYDNVLNNDCENNKNGIYLDETVNRYNLIKNNACNLGKYGVCLDSSDDNYNTLDNNTCEYNSYAGIFLDFPCSNNTIINNTCSTNLYGIYLTTAHNNTIALDYLLNNTNNNAYDDGSNAWDNQTLQRGNYWSDWQPNGTTRTDNNNNGVVDQPRTVGSNKDNYPLVIGWVPFVWSGTTTWTVDNLYHVTLKENYAINYGSSIVAKFYKYDNTYQDNNVLESVTPPENRVATDNDENRVARINSSPPKQAISGVRLVLTDNSGGEIAQISTFVMDRTQLRTMYSSILRSWSASSSTQKSVFISEMGDLLRMWGAAP